MPGLTWLRGKNHRIDKIFAGTREHGRRQSAKAENNAESQNNIPNMLEVLDKVEPASQPGERFLIFLFLCEI